MTYSLQHNGKGKYHLIPDDGISDELCGTYGLLLQTCADTVTIKDGVLHNHFGQPIPEHIINIQYCKKCVKKAIENETLPSNK